MLEPEKYVADALKAGAFGYLLKTTWLHELMHAIRTVARGDQYISSDIAIKLLKKIYSPQTFIISHTATADQLPAHEISRQGAREVSPFILLKGIPMQKLQLCF